MANLKVRENIRDLGMYITYDSKGTYIDATVF